MNTKFPQRTGVFGATSFSLTLKILAVVFLAVGASHLIFGLNSDMSLGAVIPIDVLNDPVLDSQNRFYGVIFAGNGALLWLVTQAPRRHRSLLNVLSWFVFAGGVARLVSIVITGLPTVPVIALILIELVVFPLLPLWSRRLFPGN